MVYVYDGSFIGFLCAVYEAYHDGTGQVESIVTEEARGSLFSKEKEVQTLPERAWIVAAAFEKDCGRAAAQWLYRAFLAEEPGREAVLYRYILEGFKAGMDIYRRRMEPWVWTVFSLARKTGREAGAFLGLVRFKELASGLLYGEIRPTHDILPLLGHHFQKRFGREEWAICDVRRRHVLYGREGQILMADLAGTAELVYSADEEALQALWRTYYRHMAIPERFHPALRRSFMPEKYWAYLTEMEEERPPSDV